jgi:hypothetical protein
VNIIYRCEKCGKEFDDQPSCLCHEIECLNTEDVVNRALASALDRIKTVYGAVATKSEVSVYPLICDGFPAQEKVDIYIDVELPNGNKFSTNHQSFWECDERNDNDLFDRLKKYIEPLLDTKYVGQLNYAYDSDGCYGEFMLGNIKVEEICRRLQGRNVRIEVVEG